jgi:uncharacterized protein (UPF0332 family)
VAFVTEWIVHGDDTAMIERPVLEHPRHALDKAERFAELSEQSPDDCFESVIYAAYFAMFHAAGAALLAVRGAASTKHGRVAASFARMQSLSAQADALTKAHDLYVDAHEGNRDLTEQGQALRAQMRPFLTLCARLVEERAGA